MKILFLQKRLLFPTDSGCKVRTLNVVRHLARWNDVTYLCNIQLDETQHIPAMQNLGLNLETVPWHEAPRWSAGFYRDLALNLFSPYPFNVCKDYDRLLRAKAAELLAKESFDLVVCDFVQMARNVIGLPGPSKVLFQHNVEAEIFGRHARQDKGWLRRKYMWLQWRKMRQFERQAGKEFDAVVAVSGRDKMMFERDYGWNHVNTIDTAVDTEYYVASERGEVVDRVLFVGSLDWLPNVDGLCFFHSEVWPRIRTERPDATFQIVGRNPPNSIKQWDGRNGVEVFADVPDTRPYLEEASVFVVPLLVGGGTRLKIFEAMAMQKAVVSTSLGAEGLDVTPGEHIAIADTPAQLARSTIDLLTDANQRLRMAKCAQRHVSENYSAERIARQFQDVCLQVCAKSDSRGHTLSSA